MRPGFWGRPQACWGIAARKGGRKWGSEPERAPAAAVRPEVEMLTLCPMSARSGTDRARDELNAGPRRESAMANLRSVARAGGCRPCVRVRAGISRGAAGMAARVLTGRASPAACGGRTIAPARTRSTAQCPPRHRFGGSGRSIIVLRRAARKSRNRRRRVRRAAATIEIRSMLNDRAGGGQLQWGCRQRVRKEWWWPPLQMAASRDDSGPRRARF